MSIRVYMASSLDGYIAGPNNELDWLHEPGPEDAPEADPEALTYEAFMAGVGCMLMGRATYDTVAGMGIGWPYGEVPVHVATRRPLDPIAPTVKPVEGDIGDLLDAAQAVAGDRDVYLDGGLLIRQAIDAGRVDEMCITMLPLLLGDGIRLFDAPLKRTPLVLVSHRAFSQGMVQLTFRPRPKA